jgi:hypothetical protein
VRGAIDHACLTREERARYRRQRLRHLRWRLPHLAGLTAAAILYFVLRHDLHAGRASGGAIAIVVIVFAGVRLWELRVVSRVTRCCRGPVMSVGEFVPIRTRVYSRFGIRTIGATLLRFRLPNDELVETDTYAIDRPGGVQPVEVHGCPDRRRVLVKTPDGFVVVPSALTAAGSRESRRWPVRVEYLGDPELAAPASPGPRFQPNPRVETTLFVVAVALFTTIGTWLAAELHPDGWAGVDEHLWIVATGALGAAALGMALIRRRRR